MKAVRGAVGQGLGQPDFIVGVKQQVLARLAQIRIDQQRAALQLCQADGELGGKLRAAFARTGADQSDGPASVLIPEAQQNLRAQAAYGLTVWMIRVVYEDQIAGRFELIAFPQSHAASAA